jgi:hypothetical protein
VIDHHLVRGRAVGSTRPTRCRPPSCGLAVSVRGEVRTARDVDLAVAVADDAELEDLVADLAKAGYRPVATIEQEARKRLAVVRLESPMVKCQSRLRRTCSR